jgi:hypothetical protein
MVMSLSNGKRILTKVKADKVSKNKKKTPVVPAGMTPNRLHNVKVRESKYVVKSPDGAWYQDQLLTDRLGQL